MNEVAGSLESTPSWAVASVCSLLIIIALLMEHGLHLLTKLFERRKRKTLNQALYHIKTELRNLGFMSMSLTMAKQPITKICISTSLANSLLPCKRKIGEHFIYEDQYCPNKGKVPLVSTAGTEQLQVLIFVLAGFHVLSSLLTFLLGDAKLNRWRPWEEETRTMKFQLSNDPRRFKLTRKTSFGEKHLKSWSNHPLLLWLVCLFRQFIRPVSRADYYALRRGFLAIHFDKDFKFDFQKFLSRSLDHDFAVVSVDLGICYPHDFFQCFRILQPLLAYCHASTGMKLEVIITTMCLKGSHEAVIVRGAVSVKPDDSLFWFGQPQLLLHIIQFILVQNSFHLAYFTWSAYSFGLRSCYHRDTIGIIFSIVIGILVQFLCAYITLPLYALVAQMGSSMKEPIFADRVIEGLKNWQRAARKSLEEKKSYTLSSPSTSSTASLATQDNSLSTQRKDKVEELNTPSRTKRPKSVEGKTISPSSLSVERPFPFLSPGESSSPSTRRINAQEFNYPSDRIELLEVQKVVEEIIQYGDIPYTGDISFKLWGTKSKEPWPRS
ncbi:MLO-like protein 9 isoform X2 [Asparagus officinalis]|uniref:MLO-like protein 9 isoform X2 n=1 Tax=Asparagus officinalis TaxID=4686 RepID=UPI00098E52C9|nr:MLO-like protein 9 isoform X2 [Asparagus officinalis]